MNSKILMEKGVLILLFIVNIFMCIMGFYETKILAYVTLILSIYTLYKFKNNIALFFMFFCIFYFEYSFIISRYISSTPILPVLYEQIKFDNTNFIGLSGIMLFHLGILLFSPSVDKVSKISNFLMKKDVKKKNKTSVISFILTIVIALFILNYQIITLIPLPRSLYEYLIIFFVLAFYYSRDDKVFSKILFCLMFINVLIDFSQGGRVIVLQPMIAYMFIYFSKYFTIKRITLVAICGLIFFTAMGIYGDNMSMGKSPIESLKYISPSNMVNTFKKRKLALDTSVSAYWTGLTYVELANRHSFNQRIGNFSDYIFKYTFLGQSSGYNHLYNQSLKYYIHYNGGILPNYLYYWLGYFGFIILGVIFGKLLKYFSSLEQNSSEFGKIFFIYFISTMPRWFLYYPTPLIRGTVLLLIVFLMINTFIRIKVGRKDVDE